MSPTLQTHPKEPFPMLRGISKALDVFVVFAAISTVGFSQSFVIDLPLQSQHAKVTQRIGVTDITVNYHRPLVNDRKVWGALVPYGQVWRAGANENTTITFSDPVTIEGKPLDKGTYGLHRSEKHTSEIQSLRHLVC